MVKVIKSKFFTAISLNGPCVLEVRETNLPNKYLVLFINNENADFYNSYGVKGFFVVVDGETNSYLVGSDLKESDAECFWQQIENRLNSPDQETSFNLP